MAGCHDLIKQLSAYADGELDSVLCADLERHLAGCPNCRLMLDRLTMTVKLCREGRCEDLPPELQQKLDMVLAEKWRRKFGRV
jgi:RNA polymerase sigma-70 factor, ECF subfamily